MLEGLELDAVDARGRSQQRIGCDFKDVDDQILNYPSYYVSFHHVTLHADTETNEAYAQMTLLLVSSFVKNALLRSYLVLKTTKPQPDALTCSRKDFPPLDATTNPEDSPGMDPGHGAVVIEPVTCSRESQKWRRAWWRSWRHVAWGAFPATTASSHSALLSRVFPRDPLLSLALMVDRRCGDKALVVE
ncbi:hypothetical protein ACFX2C_046146 [Malus domestica]